jgi:ElaB/YqjD/DUF883 family membrane-anchored ribosome-binding protein
VISRNARSGLQLIHFHDEEKAMTQTTRTQSSRSDGSNNEPTPTSDRLASKAHETIDRMKETADYAEEHARDAAARTAEKAKEVRDQVRQTADESYEKARSYVERNPLAAAGIAFAAGLILSSLLRR